MVPFVLRLSCEREGARRLAAALAPVLASRGARARVEQAEASGRARCEVAVLADDGTPRWLPPLALDDAPDTAAQAVLRFLESWGFIPGAAPRGARGS